MKHQFMVTVRPGGSVTRLLGMPVTVDISIPRDHVVVLDGQENIVDILELDFKTYEKRP